MACTKIALAQCECKDADVEINLAKMNELVEQIEGDTKIVIFPELFLHGFLLSAIALGVLIAAYSRTLQQALLLSFFGLFPVMFLSGTLTAVEAMPPILQMLSRLSPLRYYMDIITGVFLKGAGWAELWDETVCLLFIAVPMILLSLAIFRRRVL